MSTPLPTQLQAQAAEVEAIEARIAQDLTPPDPAPSDPPQAPPQEPPAQPPAQAPAPPQPDPEQTWEHRYRTLQGMHRADTERLGSQVRDLQAAVAAKDQRIQELEAQVRKAPEPPKPAPVSQEDTEKFGPEIIDLISRQSAHAAAQMVEPMKQELAAKNAEIAQLKEQLGGVSQSQGEVRRQTFVNELTQLVPTWREVNVDPAFHAWLAETEPMVGRMRQELLTDAYNVFDHARTATIFKRYLEQAAPPPPPAPPAPPQPKLEQHVAPGTSKADTPPADPSAAKVWSTEEVEAFYAAARRGEVSQQDRARIEAEIDAAAASGRIR